MSVKGGLGGSFCRVCTCKINKDDD